MKALIDLFSLEYLFGCWNGRPLLYYSFRSVERKGNQCRGDIMLQQRSSSFSESLVPALQMLQEKNLLGLIQRSNTTMYTVKLGRVTLKIDLLKGQTWAQKSLLGLMDKLSTLMHAYTVKLGYNKLCGPFNICSL